MVGNVGNDERTAPTPAAVSVRRNVLGVARALAAEMAERAAEGEQLRTMPPDLVEKVRAGGTAASTR